MRVNDRLQEYGIELPTPPKPGGTYSPIVQVGDLCFVSGHGPRLLDGSVLRGRVGADLTVEQGQEAARVVGLGMLATLQAYLEDLDRIRRWVKVLGMVNATPDFDKHPLVINGFSDLMVHIFGESGRASRSAVGMGSLPGGIPVEIEAIVQIRN